MRLVFFGLSLSSSWGNGHATTYRGLLRALADLGHEIIFYEEDVPWYAENRDLAAPDFCRLKLYRSLDEIDRDDLRQADAATIGSYVTGSSELAALVRQHPDALLSYYDIDTPVTVAKLDRGGAEYLAAATIPEFDFYFSFTGGPIMERLSSKYGARRVQLLGCSADPQLYHPLHQPRDYALGYLGTYDASRQPMLDRLLIEPARRLPDRRFIVAGPQYPSDLAWPSNVERIDHLPPREHTAFYNALQFAANVTRADMVEAGYSPSVRMFEAAACGRPVITDAWAGLEHFFEPGEEALVCRTPEDVVRLLSLTESERESIGERGRRRVLRDHVAVVRAQTFVDTLASARADRPAQSKEEVA